MNHVLSAIILMVIIIGTDACANHSPGGVPNSYLGTVQQGCTPGSISSVNKLRTDPSKCNLPVAPGGCNLCKLRLYLPENTPSRFLVEPLGKNSRLTHATHIEGTACKCSDGCFFHRSSITNFGLLPLPKSITGRGPFSEALACYSGSSMPRGNKINFRYLTWCEKNGGCPNSVVARFSHLIRFELLNPNRPTKKNVFMGKVTTLPGKKCKFEKMSEQMRSFIQARNNKSTSSVLENAVPSGITGASALQKHCQSCTFAAQCVSMLCFYGKCVKSLSSADKAECGIPPPMTVSNNRHKVQNECIRACLPV